MNVKPASRLSYAPILLGVAFIATLFMVAESGYKRIHEAGLAISAAEERQRDDGRRGDSKTAHGRRR
jgi:hypothetical protein